MDTRSAQLVFHFFIEELAVSHEATLRNCCVTRPDPFGIPGPLGPSALVCSGLPRFCPLVSGERLSPSSAFLQADGQCPGAAPASVKEPCESGFRSGTPPPRSVLAARRRTHHQAIAGIIHYPPPSAQLRPARSAGGRRPRRSKEQEGRSKCGRQRLVVCRPPPQPNVDRPHGKLRTRAGGAKRFRVSTTGPDAFASRARGLS